MAQKCMAIARTYIGKGLDRKLYEGVCVLEEVGHDGDHLPAALAAEQQYTAAYNAGVQAASAAAKVWATSPDNDITESRLQMLDEALAKEIK